MQFLHSYNSIRFARYEVNAQRFRNSYEVVCPGMRNPCTPCYVNREYSNPDLSSQLFPPDCKILP